MKSIFLIISLNLIFSSSSLNPKTQICSNNYIQLEAIELLSKSISYHDSKNIWNKSRLLMNIEMTRPNRPKRNTQVEIDISNSYFKSKVLQEENEIEQMIENEVCKITFNGNTSFSIDEIEKHKLTCQYALKMRGYYTYLYGLPMKLKDPGTIIHPEVNSKVFKGKKYLVLKVDYEQSVGSDRWYFYFNPKSYALEAYQFFHDENKNDGEYILLSDEKEINGIKMPKIRSWFYNKDDQYLGTDTLK